jgi:Rieske Fe-S protein
LEKVTFMQNGQPLDRRGFFRRMLSGLGALFAAIFGIPSLAAVSDPALADAAGGWSEAAPEGDLVEGEARRFVYEIRAGWETRKEAGYLVRGGERVTAFSARCTHLGCKIRFKEGEFQCPCHGGAFDLRGRPIRDPVTEPLRILETRVVDGRIEVRT